MTCNEARRLITAYVKKELPVGNWNSFCITWNTAVTVWMNWIRIIRYIRRWICWIPAAVTIMISEIC